MQIGGIILAGGKSQRMGTDKALLEIQGITLLHRAISVCKTLCSDILISSNNLHHNTTGYKLVADEVTDCGPIGGIYSGLKKSGHNWNLVLSVDSGFVETEFLRAMAEQLKDEDAIIPIHKNGMEPLIAFYNKSALPRIDKHIEQQDYKLYNLFNHLDTVWFKSDNWLKKYPRLFLNINRPDDLPSQGGKYI
jgi:molybdopterin-guanine dinucleotide biosynthesis protein A